MFSICKLFVNNVLSLRTVKDSCGRPLNSAYKFSVQGRDGELNMRNIPVVRLLSRLSKCVAETQANASL